MPALNLTLGKANPSSEEPSTEEKVNVVMAHWLQWAPRQNRLSCELLAFKISLSQY